MNLSKYFPLGLFVVMAFAACDLDPLGNDGPSGGPELLDCSAFRENRTLEDRGLDVDYIVDCRAFVDADLTIEPGVTIAFESDSGLQVGDNGSITAIGTMNNPIIFTGTDKIAGAWSGILIESADVKNRLEHAVIEYAGGAPFNSNDDRGGLILWADAGISMNNCRISNSAAYGLNLAYYDYEIRDISNCTFTDNRDPVFAFAEAIHFLDKSNTFSNNVNNYITVGSSATLPGTFTWQNLGIPYRFIPTNFGITTYTRLVSGCTVNVEPGVVMEFSTGTGLEVDDNAGFTAVGAPAMPILFTGVDKAPGGWEGLYFGFTQSVNNRIEHAIVEYAGAGDSDAAIYMWANPRLQVLNTAFRSIDGCAYRDSNSDPFDNPNFSESGNTYDGVAGDVFCGS